MRPPCEVPVRADAPPIIDGECLIQLIYGRNAQLPCLDVRRDTRRFHVVGLDRSRVLLVGHLLDVRQSHRSVIHGKGPLRGTDHRRLRSRI